MIIPSFQIPLSSCELLDKFSLRFLPKKLRGLYLTAVEEILNEAALRCGKMGVSTHVPREEQVEQLKDLIRWALDGFSPHGIEAFRSSKRGSFSSIIFHLKIIIRIKFHFENNFVQYF